jgi:hypothetical protein
MANKTELFIQKIEAADKLRFQDTYLAPSTYGSGLVLGLEFNYNVDGILSVGQIITIDKDNKSINAWADGTASIIGITSSSIYPAPGSLVFTDRPLQLPIVFSSNEKGLIALSAACTRAVGAPAPSTLHTATSAGEQIDALPQTSMSVAEVRV